MVTKPYAGKTASAAGLVGLLVMLAACGPSHRGRVGAEAQLMTPSVERLLRLGTLALNGHDFVRAFAYADSAEAMQPGRADVPFLRARIYSELARTELADSLYRIVLDIRPDYPGAWHNRGNAAFRLQRYSEAIQHYFRELETYDDPRPWRGIARAYVELGNTDSALIAFDRAILMDSTFDQAYFSRALLLEDLGDLERALESASRALAIKPGNPEYRYYMASYLLRLGRPEEAIGPLQQVVDEWPWHQGAHYNLAQALIRAGRTEEGRVMQEQAERLRDLQAQISHHENTARVQPTNPEAHAGLATLLRRVGRYNDAMHAYQVALFLDPDDLAYRNNLAVLHLLRSDTTAAIRTFEEIVRADSTNPDTWVNLGSLYAMSGEAELAGRALTIALSLDPGNEHALASLRKLSAANR